MEDYEVNVLKRNGGWKKLSQRENTITTDEEDKIESSDNNLTIRIKDEISSEEKDIFTDFNNVNLIIDKLQKIENEKSELIIKLSSLEKNFTEKRNVTSQKLNKVNKEYELYEKAINLIKSLKKV